MHIQYIHCHASNAFFLVGSDCLNMKTFVGRIVTVPGCRMVRVGVSQCLNGGWPNRQGTGRKHTMCARDSQIIINMDRALLHKITKSDKSDVGTVAQNQTARE
jgi:hypothetical protein